MNSQTPYDQTERLASRYALGDTSKEELITWACDLLGRGADTPHLRYLAGRSPKDLDSEVRADFEAAVRELGLAAPPARSERDAFVRYVCERMISGQADLARAHAVLYDVWKEVAQAGGGDSRKYEIWMYIADSLDTIADGYGPLLPKLADLRPETYHAVLIREAKAVVASHDRPLEKD